MTVVHSSCTSSSSSSTSATSSTSSNSESSSLAEKPAEANAAAATSTTTTTTTKKKKHELLPKVKDALVDAKTVAWLMSGIGNLYGCIEIRDNVQGMHRQIGPAIRSLKHATEHVHGVELTSGIEKLIGQYATLGKFCEKMFDKMDMSDCNWLDFPSVEDLIAAQQDD